ncbi:hypothetical protein L6164_031430 [Bauhinia variegata]|uniref:Uncharacterized protein n=1 Tax=Bauhinia variegata TaxID=167791 RepID=A0ACB9LFQ8_BAUVA|nr:hypothetical protein L6164_031430 [Bauhinia variegata]
MDNKSPSKKDSEEVVRESLIAISNASPDTVLGLNFASESKKEDGVAVSNNDGDDKFRSELISISNAESADNKAVDFNGSLEHD